MYGFDYSVPHFVTRIRGMRIVVILDIVSEVLHIPKVAHPDYPSYDRLRTVSKDKLSSLLGTHVNIELANHLTKRTLLVIG